MLALLISIWAESLRPASSLASPSLAGRCVSVHAAGHATCSSPTTALPKGKAKDGILMDVYYFYRAISVGSEFRRCRLHPTCSLFTKHAVAKHGPVLGVIMGSARAQMEHSHQDEYLSRVLGTDGYFIYLDPLSNWNHR